MARAFILVLDSFGVGGAPDAEEYGDLGADTFGHIAEFCASGLGDRPGLREGPLKIPRMAALGLVHAARQASGLIPQGFERPVPPDRHLRLANETSRGKDTPSGHWEIAGVPGRFRLGLFPRPKEMPFHPNSSRRSSSAADIPGILGNCHASGTEIIGRLGEEHIRSGKPICYTSVDSGLPDRRA